METLNSQVVVKNQTKIANKAVEFVIETACRELEIDSCFIVVSPKKFNDNIVIRGDRGSCEMRKKGFYLINIEDNRIGKNGFIRTLIHELVHVKQFERDELRSIANRKVYWKGRLYEKPEIQLMSYRDLPWENEAIESEQVIFSKFKNDYKPLKIK